MRGKRPPGRRPSPAVLDMLAEAAADEDKEPSFDPMDSARAPSEPRETLPRLRVPVMSAA